MEASPPTNNPTHPTNVRRGDGAEEEADITTCNSDRAQMYTSYRHSNSPNTKAEASPITKEEVEETEEAEAKEAEDVERIPCTPT